MKENILFEPDEKTEKTQNNFFSFSFWAIAAIVVIVIRVNSRGNYSLAASSQLSYHGSCSRGVPH